MLVVVIFEEEIKVGVVAVYIYKNPCNKILELEQRNKMPIFCRYIRVVTSYDVVVNTSRQIKYTISRSGNTK